MKIPRQIESKQEWEEMCTFLEEQDKDRLIDFIMSNLQNAEFYKRVYAYFGTRGMRLASLLSQSSTEITLLTKK